MQITVNGKSHGFWEVEDLPRLAVKLGMKVEDIKRQSETASRKSSEAKEKKRQTEMQNKVVDERLGSQRKIQSVTAGASFVGLMVSLAIVKHSDAGAGEAIAASIDGIFGEGATDTLLNISDEYEAGKFKSPVHAYGVEKSMTEMRDCAQEAYKIIVEHAAANAGAAADPVTG